MIKEKTCSHRDSTNNAHGRGVKERLLYINNSCSECVESTWNDSKYSLYTEIIIYTRYIKRIV